MEWVWGHAPLKLAPFTIDQECLKQDSSCSQLNPQTFPFQIFPFNSQRLGWRWCGHWSTLAPLPICTLFPHFQRKSEQGSSSCNIPGQAQSAHDDPCFLNLLAGLLKYVSLKMTSKLQLARILNAAAKWNCKKDVLVAHLHPILIGGAGADLQSPKYMGSQIDGVIYLYSAHALRWSVEALLQSNFAKGGNYVATKKRAFPVMVPWLQNTLRIQVQNNTGTAI